MAVAQAPPNITDPQAVREVLSGQRATANAEWWGFDEEDSTDALQAAINSGAKRVIVPNMTKDWVVRPITLASNQELIFESGVVVTAKRGEFRGKGDTLFSANGVANLVIRGYGATLRMQKQDYIIGDVLHDLDWHRWFGQYEKAEWRSVLAFHGCTDVKVYGVILADSGGDGIYIDGGGEKKYSENIYIRDVTCDNNYRQGISVISVRGLLVENCAFNNTWGTPPSSGVDIEPDSLDQHLAGLVFRDCEFIDNYADGIEVFLANLREESEDVSITFERCRISSKWGSGIRVCKLGDDGPKAKIEIRDCVVENTEAYGLKVQDMSASQSSTRFVNCTFRNTANNRNYAGAWAPIWLHQFRPELTGQFGGFEFEDCLVEDDADRPAIVFTEEGSENGIAKVKGEIAVRNPHGVRVELGDRNRSLRLNVHAVDE